MLTWKYHQTVLKMSPSTVPPDLLLLYSLCNAAECVFDDSGVCVCVFDDSRVCVCVFDDSGVCFAPKSESPVGVLIEI